MDKKAQKLAELDVKRTRTLSDLETVQAARASVKKSMDGFPAQSEAINKGFIDRLSADDLTEAERQALYREWGDALNEGAARHNRLAEEREQLHVQELVLVRMLVELDHRIKTLKEEMNAGE